MEAHGNHADSHRIGLNFSGRPESVSAATRLAASKQPFANLPDLIQYASQLRSCCM